MAGHAARNPVDWDALLGLAPHPGAAGAAGASGASGSVDHRAMSAALDDAERHLLLYSAVNPVSAEDPGRGLDPLGIGHDDDSAPLLTRFDFLSSGQEAWRRHRARQRNMRLRNPKATLIITFVAWGLSLAACLVALGFLSKDFLASRGSDVVSIDYQQRSELPLPLISLCSPLVNVPAFPTFTRNANATANPEHRGIPIWTVRAVTDYENEEETFWPDTLSQGTPAFRGPRGRTCADRLSKMDVRFALRSNNIFRGRAAPVEGNDKGFCQFCFQIGREPKLNLKRAAFQNAKNPAVPSTGVRLHAIQALAYRNCVSYPSGVEFTFDPLAFLAAQIRENWEELQDRGTVNWGIVDPTNKTNYDLYVPTSEAPNDFGSDSLLDALGRTNRVYELLCHAYFWSGYFYPAEEADIKFKHNETTLVWERTGDGPYLTQYPFTMDNFTDDSSRSFLNLSSETTNPSFETFVSSLEIYIEEHGADKDSEADENSEVLGVSESVFGSKRLRRIGDSARLVSLVDVNTMSDLTLARRETKGSLPSHSTSISTASVGLVAGRAYFESWYVTFTFSSFLVEVYSSQGTGQIVRFLADFLGYISMFIGITVYTAIVSPTNMLFLGVVRNDVRQSRTEPGITTDDIDATAAKARGGRTGKFKLQFGVRKRR